MKNQIILSLVVLSGITCQSAIAETVTRDTDGRVYVRTGIPKAPLTIEFGDTPVTRRVLANECGLLVVRPLAATELPTSITPQGGATVDPSSLEVGTIPTCTNGVLDINPTGNFRTTTNTVVLVAQTPNLAIDVVVTGKRTRQFTTNACGVVRVANSSSFTIGNQVRVNGVGQPVIGLNIEAAPICRRVGEQNVLYLPKFIPQGAGG
ncbi:hypothetical protein Syn7502_02860 [Synechococcus sp. PCC 7502]|uniref:hypothetical protein n=1 Tax=Synechococcus sp. PCC 7502 TaxID=1173263 RepID=UPI00029FF1B5|nr:hypothetical protein [Synechococcus sp. PCC 7502]AFY74796.1 hypothetical protein Syn7502_02860 [Synechococcus sp. PCC 7502]